MTRGSLVQSVDLPEEKASPAPATAEDSRLSKALYDLSLAEAVEMFERSYCEETLRRSGGRIAVAARHCGLNPRSFNRKMNRYDLNKDHYKSKKADRAVRKGPKSP